MSAKSVGGSERRRARRECSDRRRVDWWMDGGLMRSAVHGWRWCGRRARRVGSEVMEVRCEGDAGQVSGAAEEAGAAAADTLASAMASREVKVIVGAAATAAVEHTAGERA